MGINGLAMSPDEYADFTNVNKTIHLMGCNIGRDYDSTAAGNQSFAQYLSDFLTNQSKTVEVHASEVGSRVQISSPTGKEVSTLLNGPKHKWKQAIKCGDLKIEYEEKYRAEGILHMATKVVDTFKSSEFRLQAVTARTYDP